MLKLSADESVVIFRNPLPGHRVINAFWPDMHLLANGELICLARIGGAMYSPDGMLEMFRSIDSGLTWQREGPLLDRSDDNHDYNYVEGSFTTLTDGSLLLRYMRADLSDPDIRMFNQSTGGLYPFKPFTMRSTDGGRTWSKPISIDAKSHFAEGVEPAPYGAIHETADGRWMQLFDTWKTYHNESSFNVQCYALFSEDEGKTWGDLTPVADGSANDRSYSHGASIKLVDGRIFMSMWAATKDFKNFLDTVTVCSKDGTGKTWEPPKDVCVHGQSSQSVDMGDGRMLMIYSHRDKTQQPGLKVIWSKDHGQTWNSESPLIVWDAYGREALGVPKTDTYPTNHDAIAYGAPKLLKLNNDTAMAYFWCSQGADTHCRCVKVHLSQP